MTGKDNRLVDTAKQFYPNCTVHEFRAAVSEEMGCNGVPELWTEPAFRHAWHDDEGEATEDEAEDGHDNTTSEFRSDLSCILAASEEACTSPMAKTNY